MLNFRKYEIKAYFGSIFPKKNKLDGKERKKICFFQGVDFSGWNLMESGLN